MCNTYLYLYCYMWLQRDDFHIHSHHFSVVGVFTSREPVKCQSVRQEARAPTSRLVQPPSRLCLAPTWSPKQWKFWLEDRLGFELTTSWSADSFHNHKAKKEKINRGFLIQNRYWLPGQIVNHGKRPEKKKNSWFAWDSAKGPVFRIRRNATETWPRF